MKSWENEIKSEFNIPANHLNLRRIILEKIDSWDELYTPLISEFAVRVLRRLKNTDGRMSIYLRNIFSRLFPFDPLEDLSADEIEIYVLIAEKDLQILPYSIFAGLQSVRNQVNSIFVICPANLKIRAQEKIKPLEEPLGTQIMIYTDEEILAKAKIEKIKFVNSHSKMQVLKICLSYVSTTNSLIIDGDTMLLRERNWISNGIQISPIAQEYQTGHNKFVTQIFSSQELTGLGFVTHHGLFNSEIIKSMVHGSGGMEKLAMAIDEGIAKGWNKQFGFPSEWQLYGEYISSKMNNLCAIPVGFVNLGISRNVLSLLDSPSFADCRTLVYRLRKAVPKLGSLSLHAYKNH